MAFIDSDGGGTRDANEISVPGVPVRLLGTTTGGANVDVSATTGGSGGYSFQNVPAGTYRVQADAISSLNGGAFSTNNFSVADNQNVARDLALSGLRRELLSMRMLLTSTSMNDFPFPAAGAGRAVVDVQENTPPTAEITLSPNAPASNGTLTATVSADDDDGDNVTLTYVWRINGNVVRTTPNTASRMDTLNLGALVQAPQPGDLVEVAATPNDGEENGETATDSTRINRLPVVNSVELSSLNPTTNQLLTATASVSDPDSDPINLTYEWFVNDVNVQTTTTTSLTNALDSSVTGQGNLGDVIRVDVTPNDGKETGSLVSATVTVANSLPSVDSLTLSPNAPAATGTVTADVMVSDPDGQPVVLKYVWRINGELVQTTENTTATTDTLDLGQLIGLIDLSPGAPIVVEVTPSDGQISGNTVSDSTQINREPAVQSVTLTPEAVTTTDMLTATVAASDPDQDPISFTYTWKVNDAVVRTETTTSLTDTLDLSASGNGDAGDVITVEVTPHDGKVSGMPALTSTTVRNSLPVVDSLSLAPLAPTASQSVSATATISDADAQTVTLNYVWKVNGEVVQTTADTTNLGDALNLNLLTGLQVGDAITVEVTPHDGLAAGQTVLAGVSVTEG